MKNNLRFSLLVLGFTFICSCTGNHPEKSQPLTEVLNKPSSKISIDLNSTGSDEWTLYYGIQDENAPQIPKELKKSGFQTLSATVPGNVEIDLLREGLIKDPMIGDNVYDLRKFESYQWWYHRSFPSPELQEGERVELCFDGIDCIADIWLNNKKMAEVEDMFVEHHFDVTGLLKHQNELYICINSTVLEARKHLRNNFGVRYDALAEAVSIRKAPHMFGWDILPRLISAGIWRDVKLEVIPADYWESVYWVTKNVNLRNNSADLYVDWQFHTDRLSVDDLTMNITLSSEGETAYEKSIPLYTTVSRAQIQGMKNVKFWWPRGYGEQHLYEATLEIIDANGKVLCTNKQKIGVRKAEIIVTDINTKEQPGEFLFKINGEDIFVKGTNWVALDALHSRDLQHLDTAMNMLTDLNCNMVRLWGGNVYESNRFYERCDENGIMVWQDFTMGCSTYPQDEEFSEKIEKEARKVILKLRNHPSLVLWAGNNENDVSLDWGGDQSTIDPNTDVISRQVLPLAVREWDPKTPYLPSSPFISSAVFNADKKINSHLSPEMHLWGPRGYYKAPFYTENNAVFVSEIGYHGCPDRESLERMMHEDFVYPWKEGTRDWNKEWQAKATIAHPSSETNVNRNNLMIKQIKSVFTKVPFDLDSFITASQIVQAEAMKYFIEFWRMNKGQRNGILWWNLRDGWPIISDAVVDYYGNKKLAYQYIKKVQTDVCVMVGDAREGFHSVVVVNDTREEISGSVTISDQDSGTQVFTQHFKLGKNAISTLGSIKEPGGKHMWIIDYTVKGKPYQNHYLAANPQLEPGDYLRWLPQLK